MVPARIAIAAIACLGATSTTPAPLPLADWAAVEAASAAEVCSVEEEPMSKASQRNLVYPGQVTRRPTAREEMEAEAAEVALATFEEMLGTQSRMRLKISARRRRFRAVVRKPTSKLERRRRCLQRTRRKTRSWKHSRSRKQRQTRRTRRLSTSQSIRGESVLRPA